MVQPCVAATGLGGVGGTCHRLSPVPLFTKYGRLVSSSHIRVHAGDSSGATGGGDARTGSRPVGLSVPGRRRGDDGCGGGGGGVAGRCARAGGGEPSIGGARGPRGGGDAASAAFTPPKPPPPMLPTDDCVRRATSAARRAFCSSSCSNAVAILVMRSSADSVVVADASLTGDATGNDTTGATGTVLDDATPPGCTSAWCDCSSCSLGVDDGGAADTAGIVA